MICLGFHTRTETRAILQFKSINIVATDWPIIKSLYFLVIEETVAMDCEIELSKKPNKNIQTIKHADKESPQFVSHGGLCTKAGKRVISTWTEIREFPFQTNLWTEWWFDTFLKFSPEAQHSSFYATSSEFTPDSLLFPHSFTTKSKRRVKKFVWVRRTNSQIVRIDQCIKRDHVLISGQRLKNHRHRSTIQSLHKAGRFTWKNLLLVAYME